MAIVVRNVYWVYIAGIIIVSVLYLFIAFYVETLDIPRYIHPFAFPSIIIAIAILYIFLHEYLHYIFAYLYNPSTKIRLYPQLLALAIDYISLSYEEYLKVILAPQIFIGIPLAIATVLFLSKDLIHILAIHILSSTGDYISLILASIVVTRYGKPQRVYTLYSENGDIVGGLFEYSNGDLYVCIVE